MRGDFAEAVQAGINNFYQAYNFRAQNEQRGMQSEYQQMLMRESGRRLEQPTHEDLRLEKWEDEQRAYDLTLKREQEAAERNAAHNRANLPGTEGVDWWLDVKGNPVFPKGGKEGGQGAQGGAMKPKDALAMLTQNYPALYDANASYWTASQQAQNEAAWHMQENRPGHAATTVLLDQIGRDENFSWISELRDAEGPDTGQNPTFYRTRIVDRLVRLVEQRKPKEQILDELNAIRNSFGVDTTRPDWIKTLLGLLPPVQAGPVKAGVYGGGSTLPYGGLEKFGGYRTRSR